MKIDYLQYQGSVAGVRVERGTYVFDMDLDTFNSSKLPALLTDKDMKPGVIQLMLHDDLILSQAEYEGKITVEDVSGDGVHLGLIIAQEGESEIPYVDFRRVRDALKRSSSGNMLNPLDVSNRAVDICKYFTAHSGKMVIMFSKDVQAAAKARNILALEAYLKGTKFAPFKEEWLFPTQQDGFFGLLMVAF